MNTKIEDIWIFGDSYSHYDPKIMSPLVWTSLLSKKLNCPVFNSSLPGVSQDWIMDQIEKNKDEITEKSQIIIVLTDISRFWFFENNPDFSNINIMNLHWLIPPDAVEAIKGYTTVIQRPALDYIMLRHRLGWLNNLCSVKNWKKPLIINGFAQSIENKDEYKNIIFSIGNLTNDVSNLEIKNDFIKGVVDPRSNHLCLSNHNILVEKISNTLLYDEPLDLKNGFIKQIIGDSDINDQNFIKKELEQNMVYVYKKSLINRKQISFKDLIWKK